MSLNLHTPVLQNTVIDYNIIRIYDSGGTHYLDPSGLIGS